MNLKIVKDTNKRIHQPSLPVEMPLSKEDRKTIDDMFDYLKETQDPEFRKKHPEVREGVGLAAPQIGVYKHMLVIYYQGENEGEYVQYKLVNPKIVANSIKKCYLESGEGCLSVDGEHKGYVYRDFKVTVKAFDAIKNEDITIVARGFDAIVLQHEIDHLSGVFFYDRIDKVDPFKNVIGAVAI